MGTEKAYGTQIGGSHYTDLAIQPMEYSLANKLNAAQHTAIKYVTRYRTKGGLQDLQKAIHTIQLLIEHEYGSAAGNAGSPEPSPTGSRPAP